MKKLTLLLAAAMLSSMSFATTFEKVTAEPADWSGEYLLVYENSDNQTEAYVWTGSDVSNCYTKHEIKDNSIEATEVATITIATMEGGYSVLVNGGGLDGNYIGGKTKNNAPDNGFSNSKTTAYVTTLKYANETITMTSHTGSVMAYNTTSGQDRFRYYKPTTATGYGAIQLYKKVAGAEVPATAIALNATTWTAEQYKSTKLTATLTPADATTEVVWISSDENVATVVNGKVTAVGVGTATITATAGEGVEATCAVTVTTPTILTCDSAANLALKVGANNEVVANGKYVVRGYVTEVAYKYSASSGNLSVWLADSKAGANTIEAYKAVPVSEVEKSLAVGDYVEVVGDLTKYGTTPELAAGCSIKKLANPTTAIDNTTLRTPSVKTIENGQLVILRDGVKYNAMGVRLQ